MRCRYNKDAFCAVVDLPTFLAGFAIGAALTAFVTLAVLNNWFTGAK